MMVSQLALVTAALFTGAAFYVGFAEHPARSQLDDRAQLIQWKPAYTAGFHMQATLAVIGFLLGAVSWIVTSNWLWLAGAVVLVANWPYTLLVIMPTNKRLMALAPEAAGPESRALLEKWGKLHAVRTALGALSTALFLLASLG
jgi:hypothetical protein